MFFLIQAEYLAYDALMNGLASLLLIVAILQLVKKIPDLINTIFGTHIKDQGGIKGRLGEMAAVGGLAQKAWTSLGTGAKNVGKTLGIGALAAGAVGFNAGAKKFLASKAGKEAVNLSNTKAGRALKAAGTMFKDSWKGKGIGDIVKDTKESYGKVTNPLDTIALRKNFEDEMVKSETGLNTATGKHNSKDSKGKYKSMEVNLKERKNTDSVAEKAIINKETEKGYKDSTTSGIANTGMNEIWNLRDKVSSGIENVIGNARYYKAPEEVMSKLGAIKTKFDDGAHLSDDDIAYLRKIKETTGSSDSEIDNIATANNRQKAGVEAIMSNAAFADIRQSIADMIGVSIAEMTPEGIIKKSEIGGETGIKAVLEASVKQIDGDLQVRLDQTGNETLKSEVNIMKDNSIGAGVDALKSIIYKPEHVVKTEIRDTEVVASENGSSQQNTQQNTQQNIQQNIQQNVQQNVTTSSESNQNSSNSSKDEKKDDTKEQTKDIKKIVDGAVKDINLNTDRAKKEVMDQADTIAKNASDKQDKIQSSIDDLSNKNKKNNSDE